MEYFIIITQIIVNILIAYTWHKIGKNTGYKKGYSEGVEHGEKYAKIIRKE